METNTSISTTTMTNLIHNLPILPKLRQTIAFLTILSILLSSIPQSDSFSQSSTPKPPRRPNSNTPTPSRKRGTTITSSKPNTKKHRAGSKKGANRNQQWYEYRNAGIKTKNRKRPPRWEIEGDSLFLLVEDAIAKDVVGNRNRDTDGDGDEMVENAVGKLLRSAFGKPTTATMRRLPPSA